MAALELECEIVDNAQLLPRIAVNTNVTTFTPEKQARFIENLRLTGGNISKACDASNISRRTAYSYRNNVPAFAEAWDEALESSIEALEQEARRRALDGIEESVYHQGKEVGVIRKYSDTLAIFLLKAHRPDKYRDNFHVDTEVALADVNVDRLAGGIVDAILDAAAQRKAITPASSDT